MNYPAVCIDQLDLAAKQLAVGETSYDRFALILTDNVVELLLHRRCQEEFRFDQAKWRLKPKYNTAERERVLGHNFALKVKFCKTLGVISADEADFILRSHEFRNELYHAGIRHDQILHGLAWHYHNLVCRLFGKIEFTSYGWHSGSKVSATVEVYVEDVKNAYMTIRTQLPGIAMKLAGVKPPFGETLGRVLSEYLEHRLDDFAASLDSLVSDNPTGMSESEMIEHIQMYDHIHSENSQWQADLANCSSPRELMALWKKVRQSWTPPIKSNVFVRWRARAEAIGDIDGSEALMKYWQLNRDIETFERLVNEAAVEMAVALDI